MHGNCRVIAGSLCCRRATALLKQHSVLGLLLGPLLFVLVLLLPLPEGLAQQGLNVAAVAVVMATWWITEAIPISATALLPIALFPVLGVLSGGEVRRAYGNHLIYLFLGGFLIAVRMQKWNLHHRIALCTIRLVGVTPQRIVLGFMLATAIDIDPIGLMVAAVIAASFAFMLPVATPPNAIVFSSRCISLPRWPQPDSG
jgi:di/tricarboxylate transporter